MVFVLFIHKSRLSLKHKAQSFHFTSISVWAFMVHVACNCAITSLHLTSFEWILSICNINFTIVIPIILIHWAVWLIDLSTFQYQISMEAAITAPLTFELHVWFIYRLGITWRKNSRLLISQPAGWLIKLGLVRLKSKYFGSSLPPYHENQRAVSTKEQL